jgi:hypothetical protein
MSAHATHLLTHEPPRAAPPPRFAALQVMWTAAAVATLWACSSESAPAPAPVSVSTPAPGSASPPVPTPAPTTPPSPDPTPAKPPAPPPGTPDLQCFYNGPKEYIRLKTDVASMTGELTRITAGPAPYRHLKVRVVPDGTHYNLIFDGYHDDDYKPQTPASLRPRRTEKLIAGKTEIARLVVVANEPRLQETGLDLHTGMMIARPDGSFPCWER